MKTVPDCHCSLVHNSIVNVCNFLSPPCDDVTVSRQSAWFRERLLLIISANCQYRYVAPQSGKFHKKTFRYTKQKSSHFNDVHLTVNFRGFSQTAQTKVMITMQEDLTQNVLFRCEFFFIFMSDRLRISLRQNVIMCMACNCIAQ